jgi:phage/plasmid-like protein (TIGR03299 family)
MAHEVESMAYVREVPWHGLGNKLSVGQPLEVWLREAGMEWSIREAPVEFKPEHGSEETFEGHKVLFRSDSDFPLSIVSNRYKVVQPREVLEFYRDLVEVGGFELETAGVLKGGRKLWALAKTGQEAMLKGGDKVKGYLLLATSCDSTLATTAQFTSIRVVCNNTLQMSIGDSAGAVRVPHSMQFDADIVKQQLGLFSTTWSAFMDHIHALSERQVDLTEAQDYLSTVFGSPVSDPDKVPATVGKVLELYSGKAVGSELAAASGTAWGLLNAVTEYIDHNRLARAPGNRLHSAWFGAGACLKKKAFEEAIKLAA